MRVSFMKKIVFILFLATFYIGISCSPVFYSYVTEGKEVYYGIPGYKEELVKLEKVNADKFTGINPYFGKDNKNVYYQGSVIKGSDPETFQFLGGVGTLIGATGYSKDKRNVYYLGDIISGADSASFVLLDKVEGYGKDNKNVYFMGKKLEYADSVSFKTIGNDYTSDKNGIYYQTEKIAGADPAEYILEGHYLLSNESVFYGKEKTDYDRNTFKVMEEFYDGDTCGSSYIYAMVKDKNGVYLKDEKIKGIDPETFKSAGAGLYEDKNYYYSGIERLNIVKKDSKIYKLDSSAQNILKENNNIYLLGNNTENLKEKYKIDPKSFDLYAVVDGLNIFKDKNNFYVNDWLYLRKTDITPVKNSLVYIDKEMIILKSNNKIAVIDRFGTEYSDIKGVDTGTYAFARGSSYMDELAGTGDYGAFIDKNNIYKRNPFDKHFTTVSKKISPQEFENLKKYIITDEFEEKRAESLKTVKTE